MISISSLKGNLLLITFELSAHIKRKIFRELSVVCIYFYEGSHAVATIDFDFIVEK